MLSVSPPATPKIEISRQQRERAEIDQIADALRHQLGGCTDHAAAHRVSDQQRRLRQAAQKPGHRLGIGGERLRLPVAQAMPGQVDGVRREAQRPKGRQHPVPAPRAMPGAVHENDMCGQWLLGSSWARSTSFE